MIKTTISAILVAAALLCLFAFLFTLNFSYLGGQAILSLLSLLFSSRTGGSRADRHLPKSV